MTDLLDLRAASASRRSAKVCSRCRKRKTKCDALYPACSACVKAGAVCNAYSSSGSDGLPRSLVRALEDQVAEMERRIGEQDRSPDTIVSAFTSKMAHATLLVETTSQRSFFRSPVSKAAILSASCLPFAVARNNLVRTPLHTARVTSLSTNLGNIPYPAIEQMILNYINIHGPQYPCTSESSLRTALDSMSKVHGGDTDMALKVGIPSESRLCHFDYFLVFITLAVSSMTLTWRNEHQARAASEGFFDCAIQHLDLALEITDIQRLQAYLLLAHYAHVNPRRVDNWICIWNAVQIALQLGLHEESTRRITQDSDLAHLGNQLFYVAYGMDRSLITLLRLPLSVNEELITARPTTIADGNTRHSSAVHLFSHRTLETEAYRVMYLQEAAAQGKYANIDEWLHDFMNRLDDWLEKAARYSKFEMFEFRQIQYGCNKMRLFRPNPRLKNRTPEDRQQCFDACAMVVEDYQQQIRKRRLFYPWHALHILFEAAVVMLEACWALRDHQPLRPRARLVLSVTLPDCLAIIVRLGEAWSDARRCSEFLQPILEEVAALFRKRDWTVLDLTQEEHEVALTERLHSLLFPDSILLQSSTKSFANDQPNALPDLGRADLMATGFADEIDWTAYWSSVQGLSPWWSDTDAGALGLAEFGDSANG